MTSIPRKWNQCDPLFEAASQHWREKEYQEEKNDTNQNRVSGGGGAGAGAGAGGAYDPIFMDLMIHSPKSTLPLHSYYNEFRLGHGDPLIKAAMRSWPCTTVDEEDVDERPSRVRTRVVSLPPCHVVATSPFTTRRSWSTRNGMQNESILHVENVGHVDHPAGVNERRFILLSDERRFVVVDE